VIHAKKLRKIRIRSALKIKNLNFKYAVTGVFPNFSAKTDFSAFFPLEFFSPHTQDPVESSNDLFPPISARERSSSHIMHTGKV
jgi:hypothetical protein